MKLKRLMAIILTMAMIISLFPVIAVTAAQSTDNAAVFTKTLIPAGNGQPAKIKLEAYVKGQVSASSGGKPTDIIMVLDQSGSMDDSIAVSGGGSRSKLAIMKDAVQDFAEEVATLNIANDDRYRIAIVGFASEDSNTEILTVGKSKSQIEANVEYSYSEVAGNMLDTAKSYYIQTGTGSSYTEIYYLEDFWWYEDGWYYGEFLNRTMIDVSTLTVYNRAISGYPDYRGAFVNCTSSAVQASGSITTAVNNLDGNGATRADLGFEMARMIIENQPSGTYENRDKIIVFITDGVPTTQSDFSATVANAAVDDAGELKNNGAHIYSLYIGTPTGNAESFMKAVSSNYPDATAYNSLGDAAAASYYVAAGNSAQITELLEEIKYTISTQTKLTEQSVVIDEISDYFRLPAVNNGVYDQGQIEIFTADKTADGWAAETPFSAATATISADGKTISVTGFNFPYHCVTDGEKVPGSNDRGRKLVIYIPIIGDKDYDSFGGYLPTNGGAAIYASANDSEPVITADDAYSELEIDYSMAVTEKWYHITDEEALQGITTKDFSFENATEMRSILEAMVPRIPNGDNNAGVDMTYKLWDTNELLNDRTDDILIATLTVAAGESVDVADITNWTIESGQRNVSLDANSEVKTYELSCTLTSINDEADISKDVYALLSLGVVAPAVHIVGGEIDEGGKILVNGENRGNTYIEPVVATQDSQEMVFQLIDGNHQFKKIRIDKNDHGVLDSEVVYDIENNINIVGSGEGYNGNFTPDGYVYQATAVENGWAVVVETTPIVYTLTTEAEPGAEITEGRSFTRHDTEKISVSFGAYPGYEVDTVTVNGTTYAGVEEMEAAGIDVSTTRTTYKADGTQYTAVTYGTILLDRTQDYTVTVTAKKRYYKVEFKEYIRGYVDDVYIYTPHAANNEAKYIQFGEPLPTAPHGAGDEDTIDTDNYTLSDWYNNYDESSHIFYNAVDVTTATVPANDVTLHAFWEKNPSVNLEDVATIEKRIDVDDSGTQFRFEAYIHEHLVGFVEITDDGEALLDITLTDRQNDQFASGEPIRIREIAGNNDDWHYDTTVYSLVYENGSYVLKVGETTAQQASFINIRNSYTVNYDLDGGLVSGSELSPRTFKWDDGPLYGVDDIPVKEAHTFIGWKYGDTNVRGTDTYGSLVGNKTTKEITLVAQYETRRYTVRYDLNGGNINGEITVPDKTVGYLDRDLIPAGTATRAGYTLMGWTYGDNIATNSNTYASLANNHDLSSITLVANWEVDEIGGDPDPENTPDGIPDKYQKIITYRIIGGTWDGVNSEPIVEVVTLRDGGGNYSAEGTAIITVPPGEYQKDANYEDGQGWAAPGLPENNTVSGIHPETFTYVFHKKPDVEYPKHDPDEPTPISEVDEYNDQEKILVDPNEGIWNYNGTDHDEPHKIQLTENISLGDAERAEYVFSGWKRDEPTAEQKADHGDDIVAVYTAQWDKDIIGGDPDPHTSDDVADKYQKKVTFKIENGKWADGTTEDKVYVVDLLTTGNKYSVDGSADISGIIPVNMTANPDYGSGAWDTTPPNTLSGEEAVTYTYIYIRNTGGGGGGGGATNYTLTYETNGGSEIDSEKYSSGKVVKLTKVPTKDGYVFEGWYIDEELSESVTEVKMTKNTTVYAAWVEDNGTAGNGHSTPGQLNSEDHFAYVVGYPDGTVRPNANINRAEVTAIFFRLLKDEIRNANLAYDNGFGDVNSEDWFNTAISTMSRLGIIKGRYSNAFVPNAYITRAEFAAICARFDNSEYEIVDDFSDVIGHWAESEIHEAAAHGWIRGYEDKTFKPDQFITRAEAMIMINRVLNRVPETPEDLLDDMIKWPDNSDKSAWYYLAVQEATNSHDYDMKNHIYEKWTNLKETDDWKQYE